MVSNEGKVVAYRGNYNKSSIKYKYQIYEMRCNNKIVWQPLKRGFQEPESLINQALNLHIGHDDRINFTLDDKLIHCRPSDNEIFVYSLSNINNSNLKLESIYKVHTGDTLSEFGITENETIEKKIWARSPQFLHLWNPDKEGALWFWDLLSTSRA